MLGSVSDPSSDRWAGTKLLLNTKSFPSIYLFSDICHRTALIFSWFTLVLHYISIYFSKLNTQAPGQQKPIPPAIPKTIPLAGKPELSATSNTHHCNFSILQGQRNFKIPTLASRWQLEPFRKVWDQHQALGCHGSKCLLDMESQGYTQTGTGASEFKGTMSLWGWSKLTLKILSSPRGGTESSKEQLISS